MYPNKIMSNFSATVAAVAAVAAVIPEGFPLSLWPLANYGLAVFLLCSLVWLQYPTKKTTVLVVVPRNCRGSELPETATQQRSRSLAARKVGVLVRRPPRHRAPPSPQANRSPRPTNLAWQSAVCYVPYSKHSAEMPHLK